MDELFPHMIMIQNRRILLLATLALLSSCAHQSQTSVEPAHKDSANHPHWSYEGSTGPAYWGSLSPEYALCTTGQKQSPIDIGSTVATDLANLDFHYEQTPVEIVNNGHTVQVNYAPGSHLDVDGVRYDLLQFHFHAPSEHTIAGVHASAEMHLVHKSATGALAVVGVMIQEGDHNAHFDPVWNNLPALAGPAKRFDLQINAANLLPADPRTYRYIGSLTTPPGTEDVRWNLMQEPVRMSKAQIAAFTRIYRGNNRPTQSVHGRAVQLDTTK